MKPVAAVLAALCLASSLAGCGDDDVTAGDPAEHAYDGPLVVSPGEAVHPRAGAAGNVVDCTTWGSGGTSGTGVYAEGATADSPAKALEVARSEGGFGGVQEGLLVAGQEDDRVLYVVEVDGVVKEAVIVHDGPATKGAGGPGWYVESWAHCDYAELPRSFTDSIGLQVWQDANGHAVPTTTLESWTGPEHCDWQSMTFLDLGTATYVREPQPGPGRPLRRAVPGARHVAGRRGRHRLPAGRRPPVALAGQGAGLRRHALRRRGVAAHNPPTGLRLNPGLVRERRAPYRAPVRKLLVAAVVALLVAAVSIYFREG